jgi:hypothetical protein
MATAADEIEAVTDRELFLVGVALSWAEGTKSKPWRVRHRVTFTNSDPSMITVFVRWLELMGVGRDRCTFRVSIHETADLHAAEAFWSDLVGVDAAGFRRATIKRHQPRTVRHNNGDSYHGCLVVDVLRSADLYRSVEGWWQGIQAGIGFT